MKISCPQYPILLRKTATLLLLTASVAAFASLGKGTIKRDTAHHQTRLLARTPVPNYKTFTLRSGYNYRGSNIFSTAPENNYFFLNRVITYQKGNQTFILPMKKKVLLDKVTFNPSQR